MGTLIAVIAAVIVIAIIYFKFTQARIRKAFKKDPTLFAEYVKRAGYTYEEQRDYCDRLGINFDEIQRGLRVSKWKTNLTTLFAGDMEDIEFEYTAQDGSVSLRKVSPVEIVFDNNNQYYLRGWCHLRDEKRNFNFDNIVSVKIGEKTLSINDWLKNHLEIDIQDSTRSSSNSQSADVIWEGECSPTTFTYRDQDRNRITVTPVRLEQKGAYKNLIAINENGVEKTFFVQHIETMLATEGYKKMHFDDWVNGVLLASK